MKSLSLFSGKTVHVSFNIIVYFKRILSQLGLNFPFVMLEIFEHELTIDKYNKVEFIDISLLLISIRGMSCLLTLCLTVSSADNICKLYVPRSGRGINSNCLTP